MTEHPSKALTKQITQRGGLFFDAQSVTGGWTAPYRFFSVLNAESQQHQADFSSFIYIQPYTLEVTIPADFDPRPAAIKALEEQQKTMDAEYQARSTAIKTQINKLQAIGWSGT